MSRITGKKRYITQQSAETVLNNFDIKAFLSEKVKKTEENLPTGYPVTNPEDGKRFSDFVLRNAVPVPLEGEILVRGLKTRSPYRNSTVPMYYTDNQEVAERFVNYENRRDSSILVVSFPTESTTAISYREGETAVLSPARLNMQPIDPRKIVKFISEDIKAQITELENFQKSLQETPSDSRTGAVRDFLLSKVRTLEAELEEIGRKTNLYFQETDHSAVQTNRGYSIRGNLNGVQETIKEIQKYADNVGMNLKRSFSDDTLKALEDMQKTLRKAWNQMRVKGQKNQSNIDSLEQEYSACLQEPTREYLVFLGKTFSAPKKRKNLRLKYEELIDIIYGNRNEREKMRDCFEQCVAWVQKESDLDNYSAEDMNFIKAIDGIIEKTRALTKNINYVLHNKEEIEEVETPRGMRIYNCSAEPFLPPAIDDSGLSDEIKAFLKEEVGLESLHIEEVYQKITKFRERIYRDAESTAGNKQLKVDKCLKSITEILNEYSNKLEKGEVPVPLMLATEEFSDILAGYNLSDDKRLNIELLKCGVTRKSLPPYFTEKFNALDTRHKEHFFAMLQSFDREYSGNTAITTHHTYQMFSSSILLNTVIDNPEEWFALSQEKQKALIGLEYARSGDNSAIDAHEIHTRSDARLRTYEPVFRFQNTTATALKQTDNLFEAGKISEEVKRKTEQILQDKATVELNPAQREWMHEMKKLEGREISDLIGAMIASLSVKRAAGSSASPEENPKLAVFLNKLATEIAGLGAACNLATFETALDVYDATEQGFDERKNELFIQEYVAEELKKLGAQGKIRPVEESVTIGDIRYIDRSYVAAEDIFTQICASDEFRRKFIDSLNLGAEGFENRLKAANAKESLKKTAEYLLSAGMYRDITVSVGGRTETVAEIRYMIDTNGKLVPANNPESEDLCFADGRKYTDNDGTTYPADAQDYITDRDGKLYKDLHGKLYNAKEGEYWRDPSGHVVADANGIPYTMDDYDNMLQYKNGKLVLDTNGAPYYQDGYLTWENNDPLTIKWKGQKLEPDQRMSDGEYLYRKQVIEEPFDEEDSD